jgi:hypothetical protein
VRQFKWIQWNLQKISAHSLSPDEVEAAFDHIVWIHERWDGSFDMCAQIPSGRKIRVIWRYDRERNDIPDVFGDPPEDLTFVITAY